MAVGGCWLAVDGGWQLVAVGGCWLAVDGGWRLLAGTLLCLTIPKGRGPLLKPPFLTFFGPICPGCRLAVDGGWQLVAVGGGWWLSVGGWWQLAVDGSWQLVVVRWSKGVHPLHTVRGPFWVSLGHFRAFWAPSGLPLPDSGIQSNKTASPRLQYGLTKGKILPRRRGPLCSRT